MDISSEYPKDTVKLFRDIKGYSNDRMAIIRDSYRNQSSPRERMTFPRDKPRPIRETTDLSWDEMGFSRRGYPGWMYPQNTPPGSHNRVTHILYHCQHHLVYNNRILLVMICGRIHVVEVMKIIAKERDKALLEMVKSVHKMNHL